MHVLRVCACAGAYVFGAVGSNACPAGSARIETEAACRTAAGETFLAVWPRSYDPRGCYYDTVNNYAYFNSDAVGAGRSGSQLLCARATTGARA
jgi:hypothetical protein